jgi:putative membrane protein insertion efficiency factor
VSSPARIALALIRVYKIVLSPLFAGSCRYLPGCADYMTESIMRHGFVRGGWLGTRRLCRCHPFGGHGYDPVPQSLNQPIDHKITNSPVH